MSLNSLKSDRYEQPRHYSCKIHGKILLRYFSYATTRGGLTGAEGLTEAIADAAEVVGRWGSSNLARLLLSDLTRLLLKLLTHRNLRGDRGL